MDCEKFDISKAFTVTQETIFLSFLTTFRFVFVGEVMKRGRNRKISYASVNIVYTNNSIQIRVFQFYSTSGTDVRAKYAVLALHVYYRPSNVGIVNSMTD